MRLTVNHSDLRAALQMCGVTKGAKNVVPILANVLLLADGETLGICSTGLSLTVLASAPARVQEPGRCTVELAALMDVLKSAHDSLAISFERGKLKIVTDSATFSLPTLPAEDFPTLPEMGDADEIPFSASEFLAALRCVSYPMGEERNGFRLAGVHVNSTSAEVDLCATDGLRMALATIPARHPKASVMLPSALVTASEKLSVSRDAVDVGLRWNDYHAGLSLGSAILAKRDDERFPADYRKMFPPADAQARASTERLREAVRAAAAFGRGDLRALRLTADYGLLMIDGENDLRGSGAAQVPIEYAGQRIVGEFAAKYLLEPLSVINTETVRVSFKLRQAVIEAVTIEPVDSDLPFSQRHVVMGMEGVKP